MRTQNESRQVWSVQETQFEPPKGCASDPTFIFSVARMPRQDIPFRLTAQTTYHQHQQSPRSTNNNRSSPMSAQAKNVLLQQVRNTVEFSTVPATVSLSCLILMFYIIYVFYT